MIFPDLNSANISYKLIKSLNNIETIGPIIMGIKKPVHILQLGSSVDEIVNMVCVAVVDVVVAVCRGRSQYRMVGTVV